MALAANSYGSVAEVEVLAKHLIIDGGSFDTSSVPTLAQVEKMIDRISGVLNTAMANAGFSVPVSNATSVLSCAEWVIKWTVHELRKAYPHLGFDSAEDFPQADIFESAKSFVDLHAQAFKNLGETVSDDLSSGLAFTGLNKHSERTDPDSDIYEQPKFRRGLFDA